MKKILLIGEVNRAIENIHDSLLQDFHVQICSMDLEDIKLMNKVIKPDLIILCLIGSYNSDSAVFELLANQRVKTPVLTIGSEKERVMYSEFYNSNQFFALIRPILKGALLEKCHAILGKNEKEEVIPQKTEERKRRILVVDDSALVLRNIKAMLEPRYTVYLSTSGEQALQFIPEKKPDLILLDYEMPNLDGRQTFQKIRELEEGNDIPVVFLTGVSDREHIMAVLQLGPAGYILKPPSVEKIMEVIESALEG